MSRNYDNWEKLVGAVLRREKDRQLAYCESFSTSYSADLSSRFSFNSAVGDVHQLPPDDDSSTTTADIFRRSTFEWLKGEFLGHGSLGSVYEGINVDGFSFSVEEVSLLDQGDKGKQHISQLRQDESHLHIFHELVSKGSLMRLYQKYTLGDLQASSYTRQILHGLKYLHDMNVVLRDIKCENILLDTNGSVKLANFGLAKIRDLSCVGSAFWMAPEIVRNMRGLGLAADIWSLGCTVLEMLTGSFPYSNLECMQALFRIGKGEKPHIPDYISSNARDFILECLQVDPSLRPTAAELLEHPFVNRPKFLEKCAVDLPFQAMTLEP